MYVKKQLDDKACMMPPGSFPVLSDAKSSPRRLALHNSICASVRQETNDATNEDVSSLVSLLAERLGVEWAHYFRHHVDPAGRWHPDNTSPDLKLKLLLVPGHNRLSEEAFGHLDIYYRHRTMKAGLSTASTSVLTRRNRTLEWYYALPLEKRALFDEAMRGPGRQKLVIDVQRKQTAEARDRQLELEQQKGAKADQRASRRQGLARDAIERSYHRDAPELDESLRRLSTKQEREKLVRSELQANKTKWALLHPGRKPSTGSELADTAGHPLWKLSRKGKPLDLATMVANLKALMARWDAANNPLAEVIANTSTTVPVDQRRPARGAGLSEAKKRIPLAWEKRTANLKQAAAKTDRIIHRNDVGCEPPAATGCAVSTTSPGEGTGAV